ncbi:FANCL, UBC-like domain 3 [Dillenia turbinata]|uniref:FANCL, UBC-like domain 3 n=1 Tax=Dillenia turbinata TaxID=194707 RepID=A0AAN8Z1Q2_9MAGN
MSLFSLCRNCSLGQAVDLLKPLAAALSPCIEEIGWDHLVNLAEDLMVLSFRILDKMQRAHIIEIQLDRTYPECPPKISVDFPYTFGLKWSRKSRLKHVIYQYLEHLEKLEVFWSTMEDIDKYLWVVGPKQHSYATSHRQINIGNDCFIVLSINVDDPRSLPECRFFDSDSEVNSLRKTWARNRKRWSKDKTIPENLSILLEAKLPGPPNVQKMDVQLECGICYAQCLPIDDEFGAHSGSGTDYTCENANCSRAFHSLCLVDWLRSITTTRQYVQCLRSFWSFNVLFGNCPYCSEPLAVKSNS